MVPRDISNDNQLNLGLVSYNGFIFPPAINSSVSMTPVYDRSDRGLMYVKYGIRIEFVIHTRDVDSVGAPGVFDIDANEGDNWRDQDRQIVDPFGEESTFQNFPGQPVQGGIDHQVHFLRRTLTQPGRRLTIAGIGLGPDLDINNPNLNVSGPAIRQRGLYDVAWGPKPRAIKWEPIGSSLAARVVWECEVGLVECEDINSSYKERKPFRFNTLPDAGAGYLPNEVLQLVYNETWDIDVNGMTTKQYEAILQVRGYIDAQKIMSAFNGDGGVGRNVNEDGTPNAQGLSAEGMRWFFEPALRHGYLRKRRYSLNDDKTELRINITDTEVASDWPFPPGVSDITADYSISSSLMGGQNVPGGGGGGFITWDCKLQGQMTMTKGWHPYWRRIYPYYIFLLLIRSRYRPALPPEPDDPAKETIFAVGGDDVDPVKAIGNKRIQIPMSFSLSEKIFGREFSFNFTWLSIVGTPSEAPKYLRFGYPPNIFAEDQQKVTPDAFLTRSPMVAWDWDLWLISMINDDGRGASDYNWQDWNPAFDVTIPGKMFKGTWMDAKVVTLLGNWGLKSAPMSIHGADHLRFEGDTRMEPCGDNLDFWYQNLLQEQSPGSRTPQSDETGNPSCSVFMDYSDDPSNKILNIQSDIEIIEHNSCIAVSPLNNPGNSSTINAYVDGMSGEGGFGGAIPTSGLQTGAIAQAGSSSGASVHQGQGGDTGAPISAQQIGTGDTGITYDRVETKYEGTSNRATKVQAIAPPKYQLHCVGKATTVGQPLNPSRCYQYGEALAVKSGTKPTRHSVRQQSHGSLEVWVTKWDLWYDLVGTPNGVAPRPAGESAYPHIGKTGKAPYFAENQTLHSATRRMG